MSSFNYFVGNDKNLNERTLYDGDLPKAYITPNNPAPYPDYAHPILMFNQNIGNDRELGVRWAEAEDGIYIDLPMDRLCVIHWENIASVEIPLKAWRLSMNSAYINILYSFTGGSYPSNGDSTYKDGMFRQAMINTKNASENVDISSISVQGWATLLIYAFQSKSTS